MSLAPIDGKVTIEAAGDTFTLRLNFRTIALAKAQGVDVFRPENMDVLQSAQLLKALATPEHPDLSDDHALALVLHHGEELKDGLATLFATLSPKSDGKSSPRKAGK